MIRLLVATYNPGKLDEFRRLLTSLDAEVVSPSEIGITMDVPEPHLTYAENAAEKAVALCRASGLPTLADDSGIEVAALDWGPGVRSARFAPPGESVADRLLEVLAGTADRRARMVCWLALAVPDPAGGSPSVELFDGAVNGVIAASRRGTGGFGFDPVFEVADGRTTAEMSNAEKDGLSHRGRAVAGALPRLRALATGRDRMPAIAEDA